MSTADRGKYAEGKVKAKLKSLEAANCAHLRFPDAHAGSLAVAPADFMFCKAGRLVLLEVKEVDHLYRLPHKNFAKDQVARMRNWKLAGADACVLVYFKPIKVWRLADVEWFMQREGGSWDMSGLVAWQSLDRAFEEILP